MLTENIHSLLRVSIHAPARGATFSFHFFWCHNMFQSTPLHEGRRQASWLKSVFCRFNPRPCTRGDRHMIGGGMTFNVSIHAPARGATKLRKQYDQLILRFNPRPCTRGDSDIWRAMTIGVVSIHAPARGATKPAKQTCPVAVFQSTPLHEGRLPGAMIFSWVTCFNPRPCTRGDHSHLLPCYRHYSFNPRPCTRGDSFPSFSGSHNLVSIHAPARGATCNFNCFDATIMFQSTPLHEGRPN